MAHDRSSWWWLTASLLASVVGTAAWWSAVKPAAGQGAELHSEIPEALLRRLGERRARHRLAVAAARPAIPPISSLAQPLPLPPSSSEPRRDGEKTYLAPEDPVLGAPPPHAPAAPESQSSQGHPSSLPPSAVSSEPDSGAGETKLAGEAAAASRSATAVVSPAADDRPLATVEPAAGPPLTPRRDPLDLPLREEERWQEWLLAVKLNGLEVSSGTLVIRDRATGRVAVPVEEIRRWRIRIEQDRILTFQGTPWYPLDALTEARIEIDEAGLQLRLAVPPELFEPTVIDGAAPPPATLGGAPAMGFFLDYDLVYEAGERAREMLDGLAEFGLFGKLGALLSSVVLRDVPDDPELDRLETTFLRDFRDTRTSLRLGDSLTAGGSFARSVRFGGIQFGTNFATDPEFVAFPLPVIGGFAEQPSTIEVLVDGVRQLTERVPPGPFTIPQVPVVTGAGEIQIKVTDLLGRERLVTQSYYVSPRLLRAGVHDFSYEAGFEREAFGEGSFDYGSPFLAATHRYGFSDEATGELHFEAEPDRIAAILGGGLRVGSFGVLTGGIGGSAGDRGPGGFLQAAWEYVGRSFDVGLRSRWLGSDLELLGESRRIERTDAANLGLRIGENAHLGLLLSHQVRRDDRDVLAGSLSFSKPLGPGSLILSAAALFQPDRDLAFTLSYTLPFAHYRSATTQLDVRQERVRARAQFRQGRGASDLGLDWRVAGEVGHDPRFLDARLSWQGHRGELELEAVADEDGADLRLGAAGTLAAIDGRTLLTRRIGRAFGLVRVPGYPNVRVYLDNREVGRTDARGELLVPGLQPWNVNRLRLELDDLPVGALPETAELAVVPADRGAVVAEFRIRGGHLATARLLAADGQPLPAGLELTADGVTAVVADEGFAQITGLGRDPVEVRGVDARGTNHLCRLPGTSGDDPLPDLGEVRCTAT
ncbi:F1 capsule-anchoring protein [bacterium HR40]|nr:F1 capsule-anchoring protein [bacterium HR40]